MSRRLDWDALRGLFLVMMTINHMPTALDRYTRSPFGFITSAECFVFLSAFLAGFVFMKTQEKKGPKVLVKKVLGRVGVVYLYHMVSIAIIFALGWFFLGDLLPFRNNTWYFLDNPGKGILAAATLALQPSILDILPLYIVMLLLTAPAMLAAKRWGWTPVILTSAAIWLWAAPVLWEPVTRFFHLKHHFLSLLHLQHPLDFGQFNVFSWQLLWMTALMCGALCYQRQGTPLRFPRWIIGLACAVALVGFIVEHSFFDIHIDLRDWWWLLGKWSIGPLRALNFAALVIIYVLISNRMRWLGKVTPLVRLGQNSIGVFTLHAVLILPAVAFIEVHNYPMSIRYVILGFILAAMYGYTFLVPWLLAKRAPKSSSLAVPIKPPIAQTARVQVPKVTPVLPVRNPPVVD